MDALAVARRSGTRERLVAADLTRLRDMLRGRVIIAGDPGYDEACKVWNGMVAKRPAIIAYCASAEDVRRAVRYAGERQLVASVRSGGHNAAGNCLRDGGFVIDVSRMKSVDVDPSRRLVRAEAGLTLGEFDRATQAHGLATTMGVNSDTGMSGLTLGGGIGRLGRQYGLACDNLVSVELVTADGRLVKTSDEENPDLFWGVRGGGGNFGVATAFEFRLHPVGPAVLGGSLLYEGDRVRDALRFYAEFTARAPDALAADAALVRDADGAPALSIGLCYAGRIDKGLEAVKPLRKFARPETDSVGAVSYSAMQAAGDGLFARGRRYYWKAHLLNELNEAAIDGLLEQFSLAPSMRSITVLQQVGGAIARVSPTETAYVHRGAAFDCFPLAIWEQPADDDANIRWARSAWEALVPFSRGGVYVNNLGDEGPGRVRAAFGENYARLQSLKNRYDPTNFFSGNQNIEPST